MVNSVFPISPSYVHTCRKGSECGRIGSKWCIEGKKHISGDSDTFAYCAKSKQVFLYGDEQYEYYKVTVDKGTKMTTGKVVETCEKAGLKAVCPGDRKCKYTNEAKCVVTPLSTHFTRTPCGYL